MSTTASCGHQLTDEENFGIEMSFAEIDRVGDRCIKSGSYCIKCAEDRKSWDSYILNKEEVEAWFQYGIMPKNYRSTLNSRRKHGSH